MSFERAARLKIRFETSKGALTVEDLWDLPLTSRGTIQLTLDSIAVDLHRQLQAATTESFVVAEKKEDDILQFKFEIVKHVIDVKLAERDAAKTKADAAGKKAKILEIIERKQDEALQGQSLEDLQKLAESL